MFVYAGLFDAGYLFLTLVIRLSPSPPGQAGHLSHDLFPAFRDIRELLWLVLLLKLINPRIIIGYLG